MFEPQAPNMANVHAAIWALANEKKNVKVKRNVSHLMRIWKRKGEEVV